MSYLPVCNKTWGCSQMQKGNIHTFARRAKVPKKTAHQSHNAKIRRTVGLRLVHSPRRQKVLVMEKFKINTVISESHLTIMLIPLKIGTVKSKWFLKCTVADSWAVKSTVVLFLESKLQRLILEAVTPRMGLKTTWMKAASLGL